MVAGRWRRRLSEARSHGDIRENADYDAAKDEQALMEARIRQLQHILDTAEVRDVEDTGTVPGGFGGDRGRWRRRPDRVSGGSPGEQGARVPARLPGQPARAGR